jgi:hypothetical protein
MIIEAWTKDSTAGGKSEPSPTNEASAVESLVQASMIIGASGIVMVTIISVTIGIVITRQQTAPQVAAPQHP